MSPNIDSSLPPRNIMCRVSKSTYAKIQAIARGMKIDAMGFLAVVSRNLLRRPLLVPVRSLLKAVALSERLITLIKYSHDRTNIDITIELLVTGSFRYLFLEALQTSRWKT